MLDIYKEWAPYTSTFIVFGDRLHEYALTLQTDRWRVELEIVQVSVRTGGGRVPARASWTVVTRNGVQFSRAVAPSRVLSGGVVALEGLPVYTGLPCCLSMREVEIVAERLGQAWTQLDHYEASMHWVHAVTALEGGTFRDYTVAEMLADLAENHESDPD